MKTIVIQPVTRIEGGARVLINLDEKGNVQDTKLQIMELRGFERFVVGRPVEDMARITTRICGVCPISHHMAAGKAMDEVFGVKAPAAAVRIRELLNAVAFCEEHILHFYFLAGPDFLMGHSAEPSVRNIVGIVGKMPEVAQEVVRMRQMCSRMVEIIAGKSIHPVLNVPGGVSKPLTEAQRLDMQKMAAQVLEFAKFSIKYAKENIFDKLSPDILSIGTIITGFMGTVTSEGALNLYDGHLRLMKADGSKVDFPYEDYPKHIGEYVQDWSMVKFPYAKDWGGFSLDLDNPLGQYRVNTLARINVCDYISTPLAQKELEEFRERFGRYPQTTLLYNWARLIELLYNAELINQILAEKIVTDMDFRRQVTPRAGRGTGCVEAPRGTLIHNYECDENGLVTKANLIVGTTHNNGPMNMSVTQAAKSLIKNGKYDQSLLNLIEMAIRAYDPCMSCASHNLDGRLAVDISVADYRGQIIDRLSI